MAVCVFGKRCDRLVLIDVVMAFIGVVRELIGVVMDCIARHRVG